MVVSRSRPEEQLERFVFLGDAERARIGQRRSGAVPLCYAVQLGTAPFSSSQAANTLTLAPTATA